MLQRDGSHSYLITPLYRSTATRVPKVGQGSTVCTLLVIKLSITDMHLSLGFVTSSRHELEIAVFYTDLNSISVISVNSYCI